MGYAYSKGKQMITTVFILSSLFFLASCQQKSKQDANDLKADLAKIKTSGTEAAFISILGDAHPVIEALLPYFKSSSWPSDWEILQSFRIINKTGEIVVQSFPDVLPLPNVDRNWKRHRGGGWIRHSIVYKNDTKKPSTFYESGINKPTFSRKYEGDRGFGAWADFVAHLPDGFPYFNWGGENTFRYGNDKNGENKNVLSRELILMQKDSLVKSLTKTTQEWQLLQFVDSPKGGDEVVFYAFASSSGDAMVPVTLRVTSITDGKTTVSAGGDPHTFNTKVAAGVATAFVEPDAWKWFIGRTVFDHEGNVYGVVSGVSPSDFGEVDNIEIATMGDERVQKLAEFFKILPNGYPLGEYKRNSKGVALFKPTIDHWDQPNLSWKPTPDRDRYDPKFIKTLENHLPEVAFAQTCAAHDKNRQIDLDRTYDERFNALARIRDNYRRCLPPPRAGGGPRPVVSQQSCAALGSTHSKAPVLRPK